MSTGADAQRRACERDQSMPEPFRVPPALAGERVDRAVAFVTGFSRSDVADLVGSGAVLVDGVAVAKSRRLAEGETVEVLSAPSAAGVPGPEPVPVDVRYEDPDILVVAKPAGLVVHPGAGHEHGTLAHGLLARYPEIASVGDPTRPGIVHRLDRDTSGLLVVARSTDAYTALVRALAAREVERAYLALVWGRLDAPRGVIDAPIGRSQSHRTRMAVRDTGKEARTAYEVKEELERPATSLLECRLESGRTHQIRVHLAAIKHPVVGDAAYGGRRQSIELARPFLHATRLAFTHPVTGEQLRFEEPLPPELASVLERLRDS
jgi:23S rRNA pseudouridine1911/1915/1917 synthase